MCCRGWGRIRQSPLRGSQATPGNMLRSPEKKKWLVSDLLHGGGVSACGRAANAAAAE